MCAHVYKSQNSHFYNKTCTGKALVIYIILWRLLNYDTDQWSFSTPQLATHFTQVMQARIVCWCDETKSGLELISHFVLLICKKLITSHPVVCVCVYAYLISHIQLMCACLFRTIIQSQVTSQSQSIVHCIWYVRGTHTHTLQHGGRLTSLQHTWKRKRRLNNLHKILNGIEKIDKQDLVVVTGEARQMRGHSREIRMRQCSVWRTLVNTVFHIEWWKSGML